MLLFAFLWILDSTDCHAFHTKLLTTFNWVYSSNFPGKSQAFQCLWAHLQIINYHNSLGEEWTPFDVISNYYLPNEKKGIKSAIILVRQSKKTSTGTG